MKWRVVRASLLLCVAVSAWWTTPLDEDAAAALLISGLAAFFTPFVLFMLVGIHRFKKRVRDWSYPSWESNPFDLASPLGFFHFASFVLWAGAFGSLLSSFSRGTGMISNALILVGMGLGAWLGVRLLHVTRPGWSRS
jgi:hypothetical protein